MKKLVGILFISLWAGFAASAQMQQMPSDANADKSVVKTIALLKASQGKVTYFGHQDDLAYGVTWKYVKGKSDVKLVSGSYPAVMGWDVAGLEKGSSCNIDSVPFAWMRDNIIYAHKKGAINTISWHAFNPTNGKSAWDDTKTPNPAVSQIIPGGKFHSEYKAYLDSIAKFLLSLQTSKGKYVPVILRVFHENDGSWFWWGGMHCTADDYKALFRFTHDYLNKTKGVHNIIWAYSPDRSCDTEEKYLERYPGNEYVDIIGFDDYYSFKGEKPVENCVVRLHVVANLALKSNKLFAITETGCEGIAETNWFTQRLLPILKNDELTRKTSYVMVWRNYSVKHHYAPYKTGDDVAKDFIQFKNDKQIGFLESIRKNRKMLR
jgi:hypothetical protein